MTETACELCAELDPLAPTMPSILRELAPGLSSRVVRTAPGLVAFPSVGPLVEGHLLVSPIRHALSVGHLEHAEAAAFSPFVAGLVRTLRATYGGCVLAFEHGMATESCRGGGCVDHAHLHLVPLPARVAQEAVQGLTWAPRGGYVPEARRLLAAGKPYLYVRAYGLKRGLLVVDAEGFQSQFMRRRIAHALGRGDEYDWNVAPKTGDLVATVRRLAPGIPGSGRKALA